MPNAVKTPAILLLGLGALSCGFCAEAKPCRMANPDVAVAGLRLLDPASGARVLGTGPDLTEDGDDLPRARFVSKTGAQVLVVFSTYGAEVDEYSEAEVQIAGKEAMVLPSLELDTFATGHGIELGMSPAEVLRRIGKCVKSDIKEGSSQLIEFEIADALSDPDLKAYGYPTYYAEYEFEHEKLIRFRFGFLAP